MTQLNLELLKRFARKAQVPSKLMHDTARETAERIKTLWPVLQKEFPLDQEMRRRITAQMKSIPLFAE